jgi:hypothetical protein
MASIQQHIHQERVKARSLRKLLAGGGNRTGSQFGKELGDNGAERGDRMARAAAGDGHGGGDATDLWEIFEREAGSMPGRVDDRDHGADDLEELIDDAERALIGDLGSDFDELNARWREIAAEREAREAVPRPTKGAYLLHQMGLLWNQLESNARTSQLDRLGSDSSHRSSSGAARPNEPFSEEDWRRLGDSVLRPSGSSAQTAAAPQSPNGAKCCACGAPLAGGQACGAGARCSACVATGAFCSRCGAVIGQRNACPGCGADVCFGGCRVSSHGCGHCCRHGSCPCHNCAPRAQPAGCCGVVGVVGIPMGRGRPARRRDSKGRWLPHLPASKTAVELPRELGRVGAILPGVDCAEPSATSGAPESGGARDGERFPQPKDWRPMFWLFALIVLALGLVAGGTIQGR